MLQNAKVMFGEVKLDTFSAVLLLRLAAWSPDRLSSIWFDAFWISICCVAAATVRRVLLPELVVSELDVTRVERSPVGELNVLADREGERLGVRRDGVGLRDQRNRC